MYLWSKVLFQVTNESTISIYINHDRKLAISPLTLLLSHLIKKNNSYSQPIIMYLSNKWHKMFCYFRGIAYKRTRTDICTCYRPLETKDGRVLTHLPFPKTDIYFLWKYICSQVDVACKTFLLFSFYNTSVWSLRQNILYFTIWSIKGLIHVFSCLAFVHCHHGVINRSVYS